MVLAISHPPPTKPQPLGLAASGSFGTAIRSREGRGAVIAEIKRKSPSSGDICPHLDAAETARLYERGGAVALSVLTDTLNFGARMGDLQQARKASGLPVLRKDFLTTTDEIRDSQRMGADAVLLIVADLALHLGEMIECADSCGLDAVVEVRSADEIEQAREAGAGIIMVNQRSNPVSRQHTVSSDLAERMAPELPSAGVLKIAASGIDVSRAQEVFDAGYDAVLMGTALLTSNDPSAAVAAATAEM